MTVFGCAKEKQCVQEEDACSTKASSKLGGNARPEIFLKKWCSLMAFGSFWGSSTQVSHTLDLERRRFARK